MARRKQGTGLKRMRSRTAHPNFTDRELEVVYKVLSSCVKGVNDQGEVMVDFNKLWKLTEYKNHRSTRGCWENIMKKLAQNSKAVEDVRAALADDESNEDDNMGGDQEASNVSIGKRKRKATTPATATKPRPKPKKARTTKTGAPKKQTGKKRAAKNPAVEEDEGVELEDNVEYHGQAHDEGEAGSSIQGTINNFGASAYHNQQHLLAQQYTNRGGSTYGLQVPSSAPQYPGAGNAYGAQPYIGAQQFANTIGAPQYANNGESSYGTQAHTGLQQYANNAAHVQGYPGLADDSTNFQNAFDEQAQREYDDHFDVNNMFSDNALVPDRPPTSYGFGMGAYAEPDNDENPDYISSNRYPSPSF
ncbi:hypothetical protein F4782DRAFT_552704 [Xylaria castorea]|nr:hypothetical protein F4782DRAFT_552704 [Xylaria castorea]